MGTNPATAVVDPSLRVYSVLNLYIAGGAAFPTGGSANPTLTIMMLSMTTPPAGEQKHRLPRLKRLQRNLQQRRVGMTLAHRAVYKDPSPVYFFCPSAKLVKSVPDRAEQYWAWINSILPDDAVQLPDGTNCTWHGPYSWTIQTFIHLREHKVCCELSSEIPQRGIVISHSDFWPRSTYPTKEQLFVEIKPDRERKLCSAHFIICQSRSDPILTGQHSQRRAASITYWLQPSLVPRWTRPTERIQHAAFMGNAESFLTERGELIRELANRGISFHFPSRPHWNDYSGVDLVIAVRDPTCFLPHVEPHRRVEMKPPNKLINSWLAGVPAILSSEPGYLMLKRSSLDFLEANNVSEILCAVDKLLGDPQLYQHMIENARRRAEDYSVDAVVSEWRLLIEKTLTPLYFIWCENPMWRLQHWLATYRSTTQQLVRRLVPRAPLSVPPKRP